MRRGRLFAARQGQISWGRAPYGYTSVRKTPEPPQQVLVNETEAAIVHLIDQWLVRVGRTSYMIAERLTAHGIPTRTGRSQHWRQSAISALLRNPVYKGVGYYGAH